jgi:large subunit ribosomal protein L9
MDVILLERISRLGSVGDVVKVKNGFARNFLLPQKKALRATEDNKKVFEGKRAVLEKQNAETKAAAEKLAAGMTNLSVSIIRQASEDGKLYGSVAARDIEVAMKECSPSFVVLGIHHTSIYGDKYEQLRLPTPSCIHAGERWG